MYQVRQPASAAVLFVQPELESVFLKLFLSVIISEKRKFTRADFSEYELIGKFREE